MRLLSQVMYQLRKRKAQMNASTPAPVATPLNAAPDLLSTIAVAGREFQHYGRATLQNVALSPYYSGRYTIDAVSSRRTATLERLNTNSHPKYMNPVPRRPTAQ